MELLLFLALQTPSEAKQSSKLKLIINNLLASSFFLPSLGERKRKKETQTEREQEKCKIVLLGFQEREKRERN